MPEVKKFVKQIAPDYENVEVKFIPGATPEAKFFNADGEEIEVVNLSNLSTDDCIEVLHSRGFVSKKAKDEL
eukprot:m.82307 g.82307  ORF g.82307 m.82307 type:complete len:72 (+) comp21042_c1_seq1:408-623(+)